MTNKCVCWKLLLKSSVFARFSKIARKLIYSQNRWSLVWHIFFHWHIESRSHDTKRSFQPKEKKTFQRYRNPLTFKMPFDMRTIVSKEERWIWAKTWIFLSSWIQRRRVYNCVVVWWLNSSIDRGENMLTRWFGYIHNLFLEGLQVYRKEIAYYKALCGCQKPHWGE